MQVVLMTGAACTGDPCRTSIQLHTGKGQKACMNKAQCRSTIDNQHNGQSDLTIDMHCAPQGLRSDTPLLPALCH